jgi:hypothetical protein
MSGLRSLTEGKQTMRQTCMQRARRESLPLWLDSNVRFDPLASSSQGADALAGLPPLAPPSEFGAGTQAHTDHQRGVFELRLFRFHGLKKFSPMPGITNINMSTPSRCTHSYRGLIPNFLRSRSVACTFRKQGSEQNRWLRLIGLRSSRIPQGQWVGIGIVLSHRQLHQ